MVVQFIVFLTLSSLICRGTDISKCFSESLGIRDNESRPNIFWGYKVLLLLQYEIIRYRVCLSSVITLFQVAIGLTGDTGQVVAVTRMFSYDDDSVSMTIAMMSASVTSWSVGIAHNQITATIVSDRLSSNILGVRLISPNNPWDTVYFWCASAYIYCRSRDIYIYPDIYIRSALDRQDTEAWKYYYNSWFKQTTKNTELLSEYFGLKKSV